MSNFYKKASYLLLQLSLAAIVFAVAATGIFMLRSKPERSFRMPYLISKNFIDVYEDIQRLGLRIKISRRSYKDLPTGLILSQSLVAGEVVQSNDYLSLTVNQPQPFLRMPDLRQSNLENAVTVIKRIPENGRIYALKIGAINKLSTEEYPHNTVIDQFPPPGDSLRLNARVYLLVARRLAQKDEKKLKTPHDELLEKSKNSTNRNEIQEQKWVGQNVNIASQYFHHHNIDYRIRKIKAPSQAQKIGEIFSIEKISARKAKNIYGNTSGNPMYLLDVYYQEAEARYHNGYEKISIELDEEGSCVVRRVALNKKNHQRTIFMTRSHKKDEIVKVLFYRQGPVSVEAICGNEVIYEKKFYPEDLS